MRELRPVRRKLNGALESESERRGECKWESECERARE